MGLGSRQRKKRTAPDEVTRITYVGQRGGCSGAADAQKATLIYIYIYTYAIIYSYIYIHIHTYTHAYMHIMIAYIVVYAHIYIYIYTYVRLVCIHIWMHDVCLSIFVCACKCVQSCNTFNCICLFLRDFV